MRRAILACLIVALLAPASAVSAKKSEAPQQPPAIINRLVACTSIADPAQRLACYDREVAAVNEAQSKGDLITMDRQQVRKTRRSLFGLALPNLGVFGDDNNEDGQSEIQTTIKTARQDPMGKWVFDLAEGGRWAQIDSREFVVDPAHGQPIRIRRAALGSYLANVNKQIAVRVRRVQ